MVTVNPIQLGSLADYTGLGQQSLVNGQFQWTALSNVGQTSGPVPMAGAQWLYLQPAGPTVGHTYRLSVSFGFDPQGAGQSFDNTRTVIEFDSTTTVAHRIPVLGPYCTITAQTLDVTSVTLNVAYATSGNLSDNPIIGQPVVANTSFTLAASGTTTTVATTVVGGEMYVSAFSGSTSYSIDIRATLNGVVYLVCVTPPITTNRMAPVRFVAPPTPISLSMINNTAVAAAGSYMAVLLAK